MERVQTWHLKQLFWLFIKNTCIKYLHDAKKSPKHFVCGHYSSFCSVTIEARLLLLFHYKTTCAYSKDDQGNGYGLLFVLLPHDQGVLSAPLTGRMDTCLGIATKCWLSGDILPAQGWHKKNVPENCCEKSSQLLLRVIPSGNSLSVVFSQWWKVLCSWYHVLLTWKEKQGPAADKWSNFCTAFVQRTLSCLLKGLKLRVLPQFYSHLIHCILLEKIV